MKVDIKTKLHEFALITTAYKELDRKSRVTMVHDVKGLKQVNFLFSECDLNEVLGNVALLQKYISGSKITITN